MIIMLFVLIAFGPDKIPEIFKLLGKAARMFREAKSQVEEVTSKVIRPEDLETLQRLRDPLGTRELKNNVATLLDRPVAEGQKQVQKTADSAASIWSTLASSAQTGEEGGSDADPS